MNNSTDYLFEKALQKKSPALSKQYADCISIFDVLLQKFHIVYPTFTDHSLLHSMNVLYYSNVLLGTQAEKLNAAELYAYMMAVALHDVGMTVDECQFDAFCREAGIEDAVRKLSGLPQTDISRMYHNDFSAVFIRKYYTVFDIPDASYAQAIAQIARGHRKADLLNEADYPADFKTADGSCINLPLLGALIRLADELDMSKDRSLSLLYEIDPQADYSQVSALEFAKCDSIRSIECKDGCILISCCTDSDVIRNAVTAYADELQVKLDYCRQVIEAKSCFSFPYHKVTLVFQ
ncbi:MAG: hypothetical protein MJ118_06795 [Clostridia bacterium]|nr:hypothetical protein [Clostridia bacterium]